jgi:hypothetical protein
MAASARAEADRKAGPNDRVILVSWLPPTDNGARGKEPTPGKIKSSAFVPHETFVVKIAGNE